MRRLFGIGLVALVACGGGAGQTRGGDDDSSFACYERRVGYSVTGSFAGDTAGVSAECTESGSAKIVKWKMDDDGKQHDKIQVIEGWEFDELWTKIDSTGWRNLDEECDNPESADGDPVYRIEVGDAMAFRALMCEGVELPFPYDALVNELDLKAAAF